MLLSGAVLALSVAGIAGAVAWLIVRRRAREGWTAADDAAARHPAGRSRVPDPSATPKGPDDDREFLNALGRAIRRNPPVS